jgi:hypothetical protein
MADENGNLEEGRRVDPARAAAPAAAPFTIQFPSERPVSNPAAERIFKAIRAHTELIGFERYRAFVERAAPWVYHGGHGKGHGYGKGAAKKLFGDTVAVQQQYFRPGVGDDCDLGPFIPGMDAYAALKLTTEIFLLLNCGICPPFELPEAEPGSESLPSQVFNAGDSDDDLEQLVRRLSQFLGTDRESYIRALIRNVFGESGLSEKNIFKSDVPVAVGFGPCLLELIWSYWHEEGMLAQTINAVTLRFQNVRRPGRDPLAELEIDPLRPLSGFLWGYIQDEPHRLSVARRA